MSFDVDPPNVRYRRLAHERTAETLSDIEIKRQFKELARQWRLDLLASISHPETRVALRERARTWTRLAEEYETRIARDTASELRPSAQQHRVQPQDPEEDDK